MGVLSLLLSYRTEFGLAASQVTQQGRPLELAPPYSRSMERGCLWNKQTRMSATDRLLHVV